MTQHQDIRKRIQESPSSMPSVGKNISAYTGLDRLSMLVSSLGMLRLALMNTVNTQTSLDAADCHALAAFVILLEEDMENVIEELYHSREE